MNRPDCHLNTGRGFLATTLAALVVMAVLICALLASGCKSTAEVTEEQPVAAKTVRIDGSCFVVFKARSGVNGGMGLAAVRYPCPPLQPSLVAEPPL